MEKGTITQLKNLKVNDRFIKHGTASKEVYKLIEINGLDFMCIKCSIYDIKLRSWNPIPDCKKMNSETNVKFLRNEER